MKHIVGLGLVLSLLLPISNAFGLDEQTEAYSNERASSCHCVAFRLDDIQDFYLTKSQMEIIRTFENRNTSLTIGVIGNFIGEDLQLRAFLRERVNSSGAFKMEVANHGWNHEDFTAFDKDQQSELLSKSQERIFETLGVTPDVFIAPFNRMNNDTLLAMVENDIRVVSANVTQDNRPFARKVTLSDSEPQVGIT
ncbi:MAG: polysaccharide deacetylase family protein, partial [Nitrososphaera sp.]